MSTLRFQKIQKFIFYSGPESTLSSSFIIAILVQVSQQYCFNKYGVQIFILLLLYTILGRMSSHFHFFIITSIELVKQSHSHVLFTLMLGSDQLALFCLQVSLSPTVYWDCFQVFNVLFFFFWFICYMIYNWDPKHLGNGKQSETGPLYNQRSRAVDWLDRRGFHQGFQKKKENANYSLSVKCYWTSGVDRRLVGLISPQNVFALLFSSCCFFILLWHSIMTIYLCRFSFIQVFVKQII